jgi:hypothetical protein
MNAPEGAWVWVHPWTLWNTHKGGKYINGNHTYFTAHQTDFIQVMRKGSKFHVALSNTKYIWPVFEYEPLVGYADTMEVIDFQR